MTFSFFQYLAQLFLTIATATERRRMLLEGSGDNPGIVAVRLESGLSQSIPSLQRGISFPSQFRCHAKLRRAARPKPAITAPEHLLTHCSPCGSSLSRKTPTLLLKMNHHSDEPMKTPRTTAPADMKPPLEPARPKPAITAAKKRIVIGFVSVKKNVEA